jgi:flagellin-specific chaperone FliS
MTLLFTQEELVQYLYNETSHETSAAIEAALQNDWTLREKLEVLQHSVQMLDTTLESPRTQTVLSILNYARETMGETVHDH